MSKHRFLFFLLAVALNVNCVTANVKASVVEPNYANVNGVQSVDKNRDAVAQKPKIKVIEDSSKYFQHFQDVFNKVDRYYFKETEKQKMIDSAINGMLLSLDPHSTYLTDDDLKEFLTNTKGEFGGIGVEIMYDQGMIKIISPIEDLPADKVGIKAGDYITAVNGESVSNIGFNESVKKLRGQVGTKVKVTIFREEVGTSSEYEMKRELVKIQVVKSHMDEDIAYLRLTQFSENAISELKKAVNNLKTSNKINGIILDLRNNPGGLLDQAVTVSEFFIDKGMIVSTKGKDGKQAEKYIASALSAKAPKVPMVVLINRGSASASEIVAGAIQDHKRGVILGTESFGKGSVQTLIHLDSRSAMKITTAIYYTPNGRSIQAEGITPDIIVEPVKIDYNKDKGDTIQKKISEKSLKNHIDNKNKDGGKDSEAKDEVGKDSSSNTSTKNSEKATKVEPANNNNKIDPANNKNVSNSKKSDDRSKSKEGSVDGDIDTKSDEKKSNEKKMSEMYYKDYQYARAFDLLKGLNVLANPQDTKNDWNKTDKDAAASLGNISRTSDAKENVQTLEHKESVPAANGDDNKDRVVPNIKGGVNDQSK